MKKNWLSAILLSLIVGAVLVGCNQNEDESTEADSSNDKLSIITSFYPMYEFAQQVAGDRADVSLMISAGEDAHHYEPSAQDVAGVNEADVFVYSSEEMEHWVESLLNTVENDDLVVARTADGVEEHHDHDHRHDHDHDGNDEDGDLVIHGVADHYHTGDIIELTAELAEEVDYDHWHWYTRASEDDEWETVSGQGGPEFEYEAPSESFEVRAVLFDNDHNEYAVAEPVAITVDNHGHGEDEEHDHDGHGEAGDHNHGSDSDNELEIVGLADHYHTGDVVTLEAELHEDVEYDQWHWYTRANADDEWEVVSDQTTNHFEYETTGESFDVKAVLLDDDHNEYAESDEVTVFINDHGASDPHIWLDPVLAQDQVNVIRDALIEADPDGQETYEANAEAFNQELQKLDQAYQEALNDTEDRVFVVQHQAFGHLANRYNLEQVAVGGLSTEVEPSPSRIAEIGDLVGEYDVPVIYFQKGSNSAIAETIANETGTETAVLYDLESVSQELADEGLDYLGAMRKNLEALQLSVK
ncbi:zinc ABC transporter substrate-binding protein [Gracilibacillus sp. S3-1-1]|uniref:Zinc ABC transporter substrate-binding protein n=1 Tax=Gracilibacillus pellucidus TaxID=3095368 RepID=A0ACC6M6B4_9BACI|nr:zinc ABC transporter substrate-binding protein [Gracilibacillus sp. S3-1-1]MDX8046509.1 zinc ABC transporter substrate-binding protein [Gracilibacillus sp. S3-1-1]